MQVHPIQNVKWYARWLVRMTNFNAPGEQIPKDAKKTITATQKVLALMVHAQGIAPLIAARKNIDAPFQMIQ